MQAKRLSLSSELSFRSHRLLWSVALPVALLLAFLGNQFISLDAIGWSHGFNHPLEGWDHLITMLAVGIWAAQMRGKAIWMLPLAFVSVMSLGGLAGAAGLAIPSVEGIILLSCAVFSVLITRKIRFNAKINVLIVAFFAFFHGFAHGQEISTSASLISYTLGFMLATLLLHGAGIIVAKLVVLSFAGLLTMLFANEGHANMPEAESAFNLTTLEGNAFELEPIRFHFDQKAPQQNALEILLNAHSCSKSASICNNFASGNHNMESTTAVLFAPAKKLTSTAKSFSPLQGLIQKYTQCQMHYVIHAQVLFSQLNAHLNLAEFNHYYPNINNSPGTSLLSNGVGLTSPPELLNLISLAHAVPRFTSATPLIEDPTLQLTSQSDNPKSLILNSPRPTFALRFWHKPKQIFAAARHRLHTRTSYLTSAYTNSRDLNHSAKNEILSAQRPSARQNSPPCTLPTWQPCFLLSTHNNKNQQIKNYL